MKVATVKSQNGDLYGYSFDCPGCGNSHVVPVVAPIRWTFNNNVDKPTFTPSLLVRGKRPLTDEEIELIMKGVKLDIPDYVCHSHVTDGRIQFLGDCTHQLAGQTVEMAEVAK